MAKMVLNDPSKGGHKKTYCPPEMEDEKVAHTIIINARLMKQEEGGFDHKGEGQLPTVLTCSLCL